MTTPVGITQLDIAKLRSTVAPRSGDNSFLLNILDNQTARKDLASSVSRVTLELPPQFLDKADLFNEVVSNRLAWALSQVNRMRRASQLLGDMSDSVNEKDIQEHLMIVLAQIQETEQAVDEAFQALLKEGRSSQWLRRS
jgi:hypothetical protein